jgi:hypothetical protein
MIECVILNSLYKLFNTYQFLVIYLVRGDYLKNTNNNNLKKTIMRNLIYIGSNFNYWLGNRILLFKSVGLHLLCYCRYRNSC